MKENKLLFKVELCISVEGWKIPNQVSNSHCRRRNTKLKTPMNTFSNFEIPLRHIKKYKDINLSIWCHNIFHPPFWANPPPLHFTTESEHSNMPNPSPFCTERKHYGKFIRVITLNFIVIGGNKRRRWERGEEPFDHLIHLILAV